MSNGNDPDRGDRVDGPWIDRRLFVGAFGTGALAGLAGCGSGDGGGDGGATTTTTTTATTTSQETTEGDGDDGADEEDGDATTTESGTERYDHTVTWTRPPPAPADANYNTKGGSNYPSWGGMMRYTLLSRSYADLEFYGELVDEWEYRPGLLEFTLHDDFYYWNGENVDADNVLLHWKLDNFVFGGDELDAHPDVIRAEKTGDYSVRMALSDTWRLQLALKNTVADWNLDGATSFWKPWYQEFQDASNSQAIQDLRAELDGTVVKDPTPIYYNAFKIVGAEEDRWKLKLRTEENNVLDEGVPHYVEDINYTDFHLVMTPRGWTQRDSQWFLDGTLPTGPASEFDPADLDFETVKTSFHRPAGPWSFLFNCSRPPTNDVHFRRAFAYMTDRKQQMRPDSVVPDQVVTPFMTADREEKYVSSDVLDSLTDYGWDSVEREKATEEMRKGGFERNDDGMWTYREGDRAGEPMEFTYRGYTWFDHVGNQGTQFRETMADWGIELSFEESQSHWGDLTGGNFEIAAAYHGGGFPPQTMATNFGEASAFGAGNPRLPETVEAPPVGEPDGEPRTYQTATMTQRLGVTQDDQQYQNIVDRLTWVYNQIVPRFGIEANLQAHLHNDTKYDIVLPEERPDLWLKLPFRRLWSTGLLSYTPPE